MTDKGPSQSFQKSGSQDQQPDDLIRQGYSVQISGGQDFVMPNAFQGAELPLAKVHKPDLSKAMEMDVGVWFYFSRIVTISSHDPYPISVSDPDSGISFSLG